MAHAKTPSLRANLLGLTLLSLVAGCGGPGAATPPVAISNQPAVPAVATASTTIALQAEGGQRRVLQTQGWNPSGTHRAFGAVGGKATGNLPFVASSGVYLASPTGTTVYQVPAVSPYAYDPVVSGDGRFIAYTEAGDLQILDMQTQLVRNFPQLGGTRRADDIRNFDVDAFGNVGYVDGGGRVHVFDTNAGQDYVVPAAARGVDDVGAVSMSADGRFMVFSALVAGHTELFVTDLVTGRQYTMPFLEGYGPLRSFELSPAGDQLLFSDGARLRVLDLASGFIDNMPLVNSGFVYDAGFYDPTGRTVVYERDGQIQVYDRLTHMIDTMPILNRAAEYGLW